MKRDGVSGRDGDGEKEVVPVSPRNSIPASVVSPSPRHPVPIPASDQRILLWDIDGTLIRSRRTGAYKEYTIPVLEEVFGTSGRLASMRVSGMTDLQIIAEALSEEGFTHHDVRGKIHQLSERLTSEAKRVTGS